MKKIISKYWLALAALVSVCMFTACSSDDDDAVTPVFPEVQAFAGAAGDEFDFTFEANENWSLSTNAIWCKLAQDENTDAFVLNGTAGKQTVKVKLTDDAETNDIAITQLYLSMGDQRVAVAQVKRSAAGYTFTVYDEDGNDITDKGIVAGYEEYTKFSIKANCRFAVTNTPDWVKLEGGFFVGKANEETAGGAMFAEGVKSAKYVITNEDGYTITIASQDGKAEKTIPVRYNGMPTTAFDVVTSPTSSKWAQWTVSMDGKTLSQSGTTLNGESTGTATFSYFVPFTLKTAGDDFTLVLFQKVDDGLIAIQNPYVHATGEDGDIHLYIDEANSEREAWVYALPTALYKELGNPEKMIDEEDANAIGWQYSKYFLMNFKQMDEKKDDGGDTSSNPIVTIGGYQTIDCKKETSGMYNEVCSEYLGYDGDEIYVATASVGSYVSVNPNIAGWDPTTMMETGYLKTLDMSGEEFEAEPGMDTNDNWTFSFTLSQNAPAFLAFQDNGVVVKVVVIEQNWDSYSRKHFSIKSIKKNRK